MVSVGHNGLNQDDHIFILFDVFVVFIAYKYSICYHDHTYWSINPKVFYFCLIIHVEKYVFFFAFYAMYVFVTVGSVKYILLHIHTGYVVMRHAHISYICSVITLQDVIHLKNITLNTWRSPWFKNQDSNTLYSLSIQIFMVALLWYTRRKSCFSMAI